MDVQKHLIRQACRLSKYRYNADTSRVHVLSVSKTTRRRLKVCVVKSVSSKIPYVVYSVFPSGTCLNVCPMLLYVHRDRTDHKGQGDQDVHLDFHTAPELRCCVQCCFTSTETARTIRVRETRTSTSTFTQLLNSDVVFNVALRQQRPHGL